MVRKSPHAMLFTNRQTPTSGSAMDARFQAFTTAVMPSYPTLTSTHHRAKYVLRFGVLQLCQPLSQVVQAQVDSRPLRAVAGVVPGPTLLVLKQITPTHPCCLMGVTTSTSTRPWGSIGIVEVGSCS
jgi:hypothetical protein